ncbi:MAG: carbohydrate kinase family protein [Methanobacterium sp. ERen5]|nr:MAG: carbohydrate kinase family protein [Methanobacterium sp. ERen5]
MNLDVVGFGALNLDKLYHVNSIAHEDEESYIQDYTESCGGSAANTVIGISSLGNSTGFVGKVGADPEGSLLLNNLQNENVNTKQVKIADNDRSGTVNGYIDGEGQRALYVDPGVNDSIKLDDVDMEVLNSSKILHLSSFVGEKYLDSIETQKTVLKHVSNDVTVSLDPGRLYVERGFEFMEQFLSRTDILLLNLEELKFLKTNLDTGDDVVKGCDELHEEYSIDIMVVKLGSEGAYVSSNSKSEFINAFEVKCVDTTGAGDAFNAGFLHSQLKGEDVLKSGLVGNFVASNCVTEYGATRGLPDISKVEDILKK